MAGSLKTQKTGDNSNYHLSHREGLQTAIDMMDKYIIPL